MAKAEGKQNRPVGSPPPAPEHAVELRDVHKRLPEGVLGGVSLDIPYGAFLLLGGAAGSGHLLAARLINGLVQPDEGHVWTLDCWVQHTDLFELRRQIGYLPPGAGLFPHRSVSENILASPKLQELSAEAAADKLQELEALIALPHGYHDRRPAELAPAQRHRVALARALAAEPEILILVEPFSGLDRLARAQLIAECRRAHDEMGLTTVVACESPWEFGQVADRAVVFAGGQIMADGRPADLIDGAAGAYAASLMAPTAPRVPL